MTDFPAKKILITGGTGSFGKALVKRLLNAHPDIQSLTIFSRDEYKQYQMRRQYPSEKFSRLHFILGDIRDQSVFTDAVIGKDIIIHAAALKQNPTGERYPDEFYKTNVEGTRNLIKSAVAFLQICCDSNRSSEAWSSIPSSAEQSACPIAVIVKYSSTGANARAFWSSSMSDLYFSFISPSVCLLLISNWLRVDGSWS